MRFHHCVLLSIIAVNAYPADDFKALYNGKDLTGWHVKDALPGVSVWRADGSVLRCEKGDRGAGGWLTSDREYGDFVLRLEWKIPKDGNTGVGIRYPKDGEPAHEGMEIQILDDAGAENSKRPPEERSGSLYVEEAPLRKADKPAGEWNALEITAQGPLLVVRTNGIETLHLNLDELKILHGHHAQYKPVSQRARKGFIGLQGDRGEPVEFRNIRIKEL